MPMYNTNPPTRGYLGVLNSLLSNKIPPRSRGKGNFETMKDLMLCVPTWHHHTSLCLQICVFEISVI